MLDTRFSTLPHKIDPHRVILDFEGSVSPAASVFRGDGRRVYVATAHSKEYPAHVEVLPLVAHDIKQNILDLFAILYTKGVHHLYIEPGGILAHTLINEHLFDELHLFTGALSIPNGYKWNKSEGLEWKESIEFCTFEHVGVDTLEVFKNKSAYRSR